MKKLIVLTATLAFAVAVQAAVVDWGYTISGDKTVTSATAAQGSAYANNYVAYLFASDAQVADWTALTQAELANATDSSAIQYQTYGSRTGAQYSTADSTGVIGNVRTIDVGDAASFIGKIVVVDTVNNTFVASDVNIASRAETAGASTAGVTSKTQAQFAGQTFSPMGGGSAIPEPTSGLLLLVGAGMLALRRKQK